MKNFIVEDILKVLANDCKVIGSTEDKFFTNAKPIEQAMGDSLVWVSPARENKQTLIENTEANIIICDKSIEVNNLVSSKCFIIVQNPRLSYLRIVEKLLYVKPTFGIHPTAYIHPEAEVSQESHIGPFTYIGKSKIAKGTIIYGNCFIYDDVTIGNNVIIHAGTIIGSDGFGYAKNENNELEKFPHVGGVFIEDDVEIGANTCIDKGALGNTLIKQGAKIDNLVHIAHGVVIGKNSVVIALAMIGGSTYVGDNSWIAPSAVLRDGLKIGHNSTVGIGALVTKDIPDNETWVGIPAKPLKEFLEIQKKINSL